MQLKKKKWKKSFYWKRKYFEATKFKFETEKDILTKMIRDHKSWKRFFEKHNYLPAMVYISDWQYVCSIVDSRLKKNLCLSIIGLENVFSKIVK